MYLHDVALVALDPVTHQAYITTGGQIIIAMLGVGIPAQIYQNWVNGKRSKKAVEQTAKVGNGWSGRTDETLAEIKRLVIDQGQDLRTLTNRFNAHIDADKKD